MSLKWTVNVLLIVFFLHACVQGHTQVLTAHNFSKFHADVHMRLAEETYKNPSYSTNLVPVKNHSEPITVKVSVGLRKIMEVEEFKQLIKVSIWIREYWNDEYMVWDPDQYHQMKTIRVEHASVWTPDIFLYTNGGDDYRPLEHINVIVNSDGNVTYMYPALHNVACHMDIRHFPFDQQTCNIELGSWSHDNRSMDLQLKGGAKAADYINYDSNTAWDLVNFTAFTKESHFGCCDDMTFKTCVFQVVIRRHWKIHFFYMLIPIVLIQFLAVMQFLLPCDSEEKVILGVTIYLSMLVYLLMVSEMLPNTQYIPIIVEYIVSTLFLVATAEMITIIVLMIHHNGLHDNHMMLPRWARIFFLHWVARLLWMAQYITSDEEHLERITKKYSEPVVTATSGNTEDAGQASASSSTDEEGDEEVAVHDHDRDRTSEISLNQKHNSDHSHIDQRHRFDQDSIEEKHRKHYSEHHHHVPIASPVNEESSKPGSDTDEREFDTARYRASVPLLHPIHSTKEVGLEHKPFKRDYTSESDEIEEQPESNKSHAIPLSSESEDNQETHENQDRRGSHKSETDRAPHVLSHIWSHLTHGTHESKMNIVDYNTGTHESKMNIVDYNTGTHESKMNIIDYNTPSPPLQDENMSVVEPLTVEPLIRSISSSECIPGITPEPQTDEKEGNASKNNNYIGGDQHGNQSNNNQDNDDDDNDNDDNDNDDNDDDDKMDEDDDGGDEGQSERLLSIVPVNSECDCKDYCSNCHTPCAPAYVNYRKRKGMRGSSCRKKGHRRLSDDQRSKQDLQQMLDSKQYDYMLCCCDCMKDAVAEEGWAKDLLPLKWDPYALHPHRQQTNPDTDELVSNNKSHNNQSASNNAPEQSNNNNNTGKEFKKQSSTAPQTQVNSLATVNNPTPARSQQRFSIMTIGKRSVRMNARQRRLEKSKLLAKSSTILVKKLPDNTQDQLLHKIHQRLLDYQSRLADDDIEGEVKCEWQQVAMVLDRMMFIVYLIGTAGVLIRMYGQIPNYPGELLQDSLPHHGLQ